MVCIYGHILFICSVHITCFSIRLRWGWAILSLFGQTKVGVLFRIRGFQFRILLLVRLGWGALIDNVMGYEINIYKNKYKKYVSGLNID